MTMADTAAQVLQAARKRDMKITTAESCTGGMVAAALTGISGSSDAFDRGFVTYSNEAKQEMLGVLAETLKQFGAVSCKTAAEMAAGAIAHSNAGIAVSITGIAGPGGGSPEKPVGLVCFGLACGGDVTAEEIRFDGNGRAEIRAAAAIHALDMLLTRLASSGL